MSQKKLSKVEFKVNGLFTEGHARRCEAMIRNSAGGIENAKANSVTERVEVVFDARKQTPHSIRDIIDETGYTVTGIPKS